MRRTFQTNYVIRYFDRKLINLIPVFLSFLMLFSPWCPWVFKFKTGLAQAWAPWRYKWQVPGWGLSYCCPLLKSVADTFVIDFSGSVKTCLAHGPCFSVQECCDPLVVTPIFQLSPEKILSCSPYYHNLRACRNFWVPCIPHWSSVQLKKSSLSGQHSTPLLCCHSIEYMGPTTQQSPPRVSTRERDQSLCFKFISSHITPFSLWPSLELWSRESVQNTCHLPPLHTGS